MTQPDYDRVAKAVNRALKRTLNRRRDGLGEAIKELANEFHFTDVKFDTTRFFKTCLK